MGKNVYHDVEKIYDAIGLAEELNFRNEQDQLYFIRNKTGYDLSESALQYHKKEFHKRGINATSLLQTFAQSKILKTISTHYALFEDVRNDLAYVYNKKMLRYKETIANGEVGDPIELQEILQIANALKDASEHIEKRHLAFTMLIPVKLQMDKNIPKLDNADPDTRNALLVAENLAEEEEEMVRNMQNLTDIHGDENLVA